MHKFMGVPLFTPLALYHWGYIGAVMAVMFVLGTIIAKLIHR